MECFVSPVRIKIGTYNCGTVRISIINMCDGDRKMNGEVRKFCQHIFSPLFIIIRAKDTKSEKQIFKQKKIPFVSGRCFLLPRFFFLRSFLAVQCDQNKPPLSLSLCNPTKHHPFQSRRTRTTILTNSYTAVQSDEATLNAVVAVPSPTAI